MNIVLPESLVPVVQRRAEARGFESAEAYVAALIQADDDDAWWATLTPEQQQEHDRIEQLLLKSLNSGPSIVADEAFWEAKRQRLRERRAQGVAGQSPS
jgi:Arc/MetJ-type ribon-helix-helix transcriptional regulator